MPKPVPMIVVNGDNKEVPENFAVADLLGSLGLVATQVAVELNRDVLPRSEYDQTLLRAEDRLEIVTFVGGG